jgi:toxin-antitoxin system PIN domain toxin
MTSLPDVNVWLALTIGEHVHHAPATAWLDKCTDAIGFCRVTQMGFLRLLTNSHVMAGDALTALRAWTILDAYLQDDRFRKLPEPAGLEEQWRSFSKRPSSGPNVWTDAYLAAFAIASRCTLVTFDKAFRRYKGAAVQLLA